jgi:3-deoxy-7-phosphoheptulonate synthase
MESPSDSSGRMPVSQARLAAAESKPEGTLVVVPGATIGGEEIAVFAGPCAVESRDQLLKAARAVQESGASVLRAGAFKPRTSPYSFQGLKEEGLELLDFVRQETGLSVVTEVMETRRVELVSRYANILQVGSRQMHAYPLLKEVGRSGMPVLLKRGWAATLEELLYAAEYILKQGNDQVILCERGIRTFEPSTRNTLDLNAVPWLKRQTHLPVIVDPSHGTGHRWMVPAMSQAAIAAGADGLLVEVHPDPDTALSDGSQSLTPDEFKALMQALERIAPAIGRRIRGPGHLASAESPTS